VSKEEAWTRTLVTDTLKQLHKILTEKLSDWGLMTYWSRSQRGVEELREQVMWMMATSLGFTIKVEKKK
jgi:hypothetical protein